ncbi:hypothetical protein [Massilia sp. 9096]|jgi:hypothetical protein|uniref:hypothetical protein n=1 Tax=Massilia sp. 9096 TaxID=1500894 RepID=UPI0012E05861|nr:hypothetical protein [Massilia sp. 9096]
MKTYQGILIAGMMAMGLAACSSTDMNTTRVGTQDAANATDHVNGTNGGGADNSMGNSAGTGNNGVGANSR